MINPSECLGFHACPLIFGLFSRATARVIALRCAGSVHIYVHDLLRLELGLGLGLGLGLVLAVQTEQ
jgi:hypothetical protein